MSFSFPFGLHKSQAQNHEQILYKSQGEMFRHAWKLNEEVRRHTLKSYVASGFSSQAITSGAIQ